MNVRSGDPLATASRPRLTAAKARFRVRRRLGRRLHRGCVVRHCRRRAVAAIQTFPQTTATTTTDVRRARFRFCRAFEFPRGGVGTGPRDRRWAQKSRNETRVRRPSPLLLRPIPNCHMDPSEPDPPLILPPSPPDPAPPPSSPRSPNPPLRVDRPWKSRLY